MRGGWVDGMVRDVNTQQSTGWREPRVRGPRWVFALAAALGVLTGVECALGQFGPIGRRVAPAPGQPVPVPQSPRPEGGLPDGPTGVETEVIPAGVRVRWSAVAGSISGYRIYRERLVGPGQWGEATTISVPATAVEYSDVPPFSGQYRYRVHWYRLMLNSRWSLSSTVTVSNRPAPAPTSPSGVGALDVGERRAMVSWSDESPNETGFELERLPAFPSGRRIVAANVTAVVDDSGPGVFSYRVRALGGSGPSGFSPWTQVRVRDTVPASPSGVSAVDAGNERDTRVRWTDNSNNESGFRIERERRQADGTWGEATILAAPANTTELIDPAGGGTFRYRVAATNLEGSSATTEWGGVIVVSGWTELIRSPDSRVVYVSSSEGSDSNDGLSPERPVRTLAAGYALLRHGYPDWMLLKRGDLWRESLGHWKKGGRNGAEPMVIWGYGVGPRPRLLTQGGRGFVTQGGAGSPETIDYLAIKGLHMTPEAFNPLQVQTGLQFLRPGTGLLVEDCRLEGYGTNLTFDTAAGQFSNVAIRRCILANAYTNQGHSQGMYADEVIGLLIEECVFYHNGWNPEVTGADPTPFNHNMYLSTRTRDVTVRGNISCLASSHGLQARSGGVVSDNLFIRNSISFLVGGGDVPVVGGVPAIVERNTVLEAKDISPALPRGIGLTLTNVSSGRVIQNLFMRDASIGPSAAIRVSTSSTLAVNNVEFADNTVYAWRGGAVSFDAANASGLVFRRNRFALPGTEAQLVSHPVAPAAGAVVYEQNRYDFGGAANRWFRIAGSQMTFDAWRSSVEPTAAREVLSVQDPTVGVEWYMEQIGRERSFQSFVDAVLGQSESNWDNRLTGKAMSAAMRAAMPNN